MILAGMVNHIEFLQYEKLHSECSSYEPGRAAFRYPRKQVTKNHV